MNPSILSVISGIVFVLASTAYSFSITQRTITQSSSLSRRENNIQHCNFRLKNSISDEDQVTAVDGSDVKMSLEEKMKNWEASEEEIKQASLGGMTPGAGGKTDSFDIGLYIAFPIIVITSLAFAIFPFIMDKIDVSSVGPPPMV